MRGLLKGRGGALATPLFRIALCVSCAAAAAATYGAVSAAGVTPGEAVSEAESAALVGGQTCGCWGIERYGTCEFHFLCIFDRSCPEGLGCWFPSCDSADKCTMKPSGNMVCLVDLDEPACYDLRIGKTECVGL